METTRLGWHHLTLDVPRTWEVVGYVNDARQGRLLLRDRYGDALQISWGACAQKPDLTRRLLNVLAADAANRTPLDKPGAISPGGGTGPATAAVGRVPDPATRSATAAKPDEREARRNIRTVHGWETYVPTDPAQAVLACRYDEDEKVLLYAVFPPHADTRNRAVVERVLGSYRPNGGEERVWAAFGLDVTLPQSMVPDRVTPLPASQVMRFENRAGESVTIHRYGMLSALLGEDDVGAFFARMKGKKHLLYKEGEFLKDGKWPGVVLSYKTRGPGGLAGFMARAWHGRVWVWRCDELERLYCADNNAQQKNLIPDLPDRVRCQ